MSRVKRVINFFILLGLFMVPFNFSFAFTTDYRYTGKPLDINTNLYYYGQRYYDPNVGQFTQPDPVSRYLTDPQKLRQATGQNLQQFLQNPQALNEYSYTQNNPIRYVDPTGEYTQEAYQNNSLAVRSWKNVAIGLRLIGWNVSSYFLNRAVSLNPGTLNIRQGQDQHKVIDKIQKSNEYQNFVRARIKDTEDSGLTEINFTGGKNTANETIIFNKGDLGYSIHKVTNIYITGKKNSDGEWEIHTKLFDQYDFQPETYPTDGNILQKGINQGVRWADQSEQNDVISNYDINIEFDDKINN